MSAREEAKRIVIIGGGMSGLAAALRLIERRRECGLDLDVRLLEAKDTVGGSIETQTRDGFLLEGGPDAFITAKPWAIALCRRLGIADSVIQTNEKHRRAFIVRKGKLHPIPEGFVLLAPTRIWPFALTRLFSWPGKLRMAMDLVLPRGPRDSDQSLGDFVRRRLGRQALERVAQPLVSGIYASDPNTLSLRATMPRFLELEARHRSLILGMRAGQKAAGENASSDSGARYSIFVTMRRGMASLVDAVAGRLPDGTVRTGCPVVRLSPHIGGSRWSVEVEGVDRIDADGVVLAAPAYALADMLGRGAPDVAAQMQDINYASTLTVNLAFNRQDIAHRLDAFGLVVPAVEQMAMIGATFANVKFPGRAPEGKALIRAFVGGALNPWAFDMDDREVVRRVLSELRDLIRVRGEPQFWTIHRWPRAMAQFPVGHLDRVRRIDELLGAYPPAATAGNAFAGGGVPDCVHRGESAADNVLQRVMSGRA
ncbi:MAG: protoporphyrinogen oxidase [Phycisphaerales bacterium]|nr:MAG: protoporphyrinogen oxidase [Phycisphaerales bacterium]